MTMTPLPPLPPGSEPFVHHGNSGPMFRYNESAEALCWDGLSKTDKLLFSSLCYRLWIKAATDASTKRSVFSNHHAQAWMELK